MCAFPCVGPGEVLHPQGVPTVEQQDLQCQENNGSTEEEFEIISDAEEDVNVEACQLPLLDQHQLQDNSTHASMGGDPIRQPPATGDLGQCEFEYCSLTAGDKGRAAKALVGTDSTLSPEAASHRSGATGVPVCKEDFFKYVKFMHASSNRVFQSEYSVSAAVVL